jgi:hypothetical protein
LFEVDILLSNDRYTYGFIIDSKKVREEWLYAYPQGKKQSWFVRRSAGAHEYTFSRFLVGENKAIQALTRPNSLFFSAAAQNNHRLLIPIFEWFAKTTSFVNEVNRDGSRFGYSAAGKYCDSQFQERILEIVRNSDLGVIGIDIENEDFSDNLKKAVEALLAEHPEALKQVMASSPRVAHA